MTPIGRRRGMSRENRGSKMGILAGGAKGERVALPNAEIMIHQPPIRSATTICRLKKPLLMG